MKAVHTTKLWKAYSGSDPLLCFFNNFCIDSFSPCLLCDYSRYRSCSSGFLIPFLHGGALCPLSYISAHATEIKAALPDTGLIVLSSHTALFSSGFALPDNGFQRTHSKFPIFHIRFSSLGNARSLPTQS